MEIRPFLEVDAVVEVAAGAVDFAVAVAAVVVAIATARALAAATLATRTSMPIPLTRDRRVAAAAVRLMNMAVPGITTPTTPATSSTTRSSLTKRTSTFPGSISKSKTRHRSTFQTLAVVE